MKINIQLSAKIEIMIIIMFILFVIYYAFILPKDIDVVVEQNLTIGCSDCQNDNVDRYGLK